MIARTDLNGQEFGRLTVIGRAYPEKREKAITWLCACTCGGNALVQGGSLRAGRTQSCGCLMRQKAAACVRAQFTTHGQTGTPLYRSWVSMRARTGRPSHKDYPNYGGRGIRVCERWASFEAFAADMGAAWQPGLTLDRIDVNGNYEPGNTRWATQKEQQRNRRSNRLLTFQGRTMCVTEWADLLGWGKTRIYQRLRYGWPTERALTEGADPAVLAQLSDGAEL